MALIVQKYGGTSVADADRLKRVAHRIAETRRAGNQVIVVVSAMGSAPSIIISNAVRSSIGPRKLTSGNFSRSCRARP